MPKLKVYFSKSNSCDLNTVNKVRLALQKYDVEVVEFKGGPYTHNPLLGCDYMLVLGPQIESDPLVGRGQYEQCKAFIEYNRQYSESDAKDHILVVEDYDSDEDNWEMFVATLDHLEDIHQDDSGWSHNYGSISTHSDRASLDNWLDLKADWPRGEEDDEYADYPTLGDLRDAERLSMKTSYKPPTNLLLVLHKGFK